jgi:hypothetical protein
MQPTVRTYNVSIYVVRKHQLLLPGRTDPKLDSKFPTFQATIPTTLTVGMIADQ